MDFSTEHKYPAPPAAVLSMLTNKEFIELLLAKAETHDAVIEVDGNTTTASCKIDAPEKVAMFTGKFIDITLTIEWGEPAADGSYKGPIILDLGDIPAKLTGTAEILPDGTGTKVRYAGEFNITVPFIGAKLEATAFPYIIQVIDMEQPIGLGWLEMH
jgi:carbon monoxide dehydrogenase subunit G